MLRGRGAERDAVEILVAGAAGGRGGARLFVGPAGSGKSALLDEVEAWCPSSRCLRASGLGGAQAAGYATLAQLVGPVLGRLSELDPVRAEVLASALEVGPPSPGDRHAVAVTALDLLARTASPGQATLVLVDDLHLADDESLECLTLLARLLDTAAIVVVATADRALAGWDLGQIGELGPLDDESSRSVLREIVPEQRLVAPVVEAVLAAAAGNPAVLHELGAKVAAGAAGSLPVSWAASMVHADDIAGAHLDQVDPGTRRALELAALAVFDDTGSLTRACLASGLDRAVLDDAVDIDLLTIGQGRFRFARPTMRSLVASSVGEADRRRIHGVLAESCAGPARIWHRAEASAAADDAIAADLEVAAAELLGRRSYSLASTWFERAAWASVDPTARLLRLLAAGASAGGAGQSDRAVALLTRAVDDAPGPELRGLAGHALGLVQLWAGNTDRAQRYLVREAELVGDADPERAAHMLADAALANTAVGDCHRALELAERADRLAPHAGSTTRGVIDTALSWALVLRGDTARALAVLDRSDATDAMTATLTSLDPAAPSLALGLNVRLFSDDYERARDEARERVATAEASGELASQPFALGVRCEAELRLGEVDGLRERYDHAISLARMLGQDPPLAFLLVSRARLDAVCGREDECRAGVASARSIAARLGMGSTDGFGLGALGVLELGANRNEQALEVLAELAALVAAQGMRCPTLIPWLADVVEANVRLGRDDAAAAAVDLLAEQTATAGGPVAGAVLARCRGLVATEDADAAESSFREAQRLHDLRPLPFERARTDLVFGERLRRDRRRAAAREQLRAAAAAFTRLGATPWADRATAELRATGADLPATDGVAALTPQQLRVAEAVARGARNREIADELFVSTKTVESHLMRIYRTLGIRSRTELAAWVVSRGSAGPG